MTKNENQKIEILKINNLAYQSYRRFVMGNFNLSESEVAKKLTRNVMLGTPIAVPDTNHVWYAYGRLRILVKNGNKVTCVMNHQPILNGWTEDLAMKKWLNKKLKIS